MFSLYRSVMLRGGLMIKKAAAAKSLIVQKKTHGHLVNPNVIVC